MRLFHVLPGTICNGNTVQESIVPVVTARGRVQQRSVVPHDQHPGLPLVAVQEPLLGLVLVELHQQSLGRFRRHISKALYIGCR